MLQMKHKVVSAKWESAFLTAEEATLAEKLDRYHVRVDTTDEQCPYLHLATSHPRMSCQPSHKPGLLMMAPLPGNVRGGEEGVGCRRHRRV